MSLKFVALGSLTALSVLGTPPPADDQVQNLGLVRPHERILITFGRWNSAPKPEKPEAAGIEREARGATGPAPRQKRPAFVANPQSKIVERTGIS